MLRKFALVDHQVVDATPTGLQKWAHRHVFDYTPRRGYIYVKSRAISSRTNDNYDSFPSEELKKGWHSFIGRPVFVNHNNQDIKRMRGVIIDAALHEDKAPDGTDDTWVEVLMEVDAKRFPKLAKALIEREIERTSMGVDVEWSECSYCGNKAKVPSDYCQHIQRMKGQRLRRKNAVTGEIEDVLVHEICSGLSFFENSLLVEEPADPTAYAYGLDVRGILDEDELVERLAKVASFRPRRQVLAMEGNFGFDSQKDQFDPSGPPGVSYFKGDMGDGKYIDCLLWRDPSGELRGVLYHYPFNFDLERKGNVNVLVDPAWQRQGIATELMTEAMKRFGINFDQQTYTDEGQKFIDKFIERWPHKGSLANVASFKPPRSATSSAMEAARKATEWIERDGHDLRQWRISYNSDPKEYSTECTQCGRVYQIRRWDERQRKSIEDHYPRILDSYLRRVLTPEYILGFSNGEGEDQFFAHQRCDPVATAMTVYRGLQLYDPATMAKVAKAFQSGSTSRLGQEIIDFFMQRGGLGHSWSGTEKIARGYAKSRIMSLDMSNTRDYDFDPKEFGGGRQEFIPVFLTGKMLRSDQRKNYKPSDMMSMGPLPEYEHENEIYLSKNEVMTIAVEVWWGDQWHKVGEGIKAKAMLKTAGCPVLVDDLDANDRWTFNRPGILRQEVRGMALVQFANGEQRMFPANALTFTDEFFDGRVASKTALADPGGWHVYGPFPPTKRPGPVRYSKNWMVIVRGKDVARQYLFATEEAAMAFVEEANHKPLGEVDQSRVLYASKTAAWFVMDAYDRSAPIAGPFDNIYEAQEAMPAATEDDDVARYYLSNTASKTAAEALTDEQKARFKGTGIDKDDDGFYCKTHRCRSDSYPSIDEIPDSVIEFIESTGAKMKRRDKSASLDIGVPNEMRYPAQIETLRPPSCPVCESDAAWTSEGRCSVCGYLPPPKPFREPDTEIAGRVDQDGGWFNPELTQATPFKTPDANDPVQSPIPAKKGQRLIEGVSMPAESVAAAARRRLVADRALAEENAQLRARVAQLTKTADTENPAQPVEEPAAQAAVPTSEATTIDVEQKGGEVEVTDPTPTDDVTTPGGVMPAAEAPSTDVEAPVSGTQEVDPAASAQTAPNVEGETIGENAFGGDWINPGTSNTIGPSASRAQRAEMGRVAGLVRDRIWASVRLARLRIQTGIAEVHDDLELGRQIEASKMSMGEIQAESSGLHKAMQARPIVHDRPAGRMASRGRSPSLAAAAQEEQGMVGGLAGRGENEALFE